MPDLTRENALAIIAAHTARLDAAAGPLAPAEAFAVEAAALGLEEPGFDWQAWPPAHSGEVSDPAFVAGADPETLRRIMTTHLRMNRFADGHLELIEQQGVLAAVVARLQALVDTGAI
jgi:hypothetical protein